MTQELTISQYKKETTIGYEILIGFFFICVYSGLTLLAIYIFKFADKTFNDLKRFTGVVAYNKGVDFLRFVNSEKRGSGGVLSLNEKIGEKGITRLELVASRLENFDYYKLFDYVSAVDDCRNETLNEKEKNFIHSYYIFGDCHREIAKKNKLPNEKSIGITIHRSLVKLEKCLNAKKFENPFNHENLGP